MGRRRTFQTVLRSLSIPLEKVSSIDGDQDVRIARLGFEPGETSCFSSATECFASNHVRATISMTEAKASRRSAV